MVLTWRRELWRLAWNIELFLELQGHWLSLTKSRDPSTRRLLIFV
nr:hypothetical protein Iba_chr04eCG10720 [Ipomoea batatas]